MRFFRVVAGVTVAATMVWAAVANSQLTGADDESRSAEPGAPAVADAEAPAEASEEAPEGSVMEEIEVVVGPQGRTEFEIEKQRQAQMREALYAEMRMRERREEELAWRQADPDLQSPESRIKWGYSPQAEQRMRRDTAFMNDLSMDEYEPASIFRVEF